MVIEELGGGRDDALATYVPHLVQLHGPSAPVEQLISVDGTMVSADISGFTALSERLAALGNEGAEQLTDLLNRCFTQMIDASDAVGGDVIKFGGDALLILLSGPDHARRAAIAMAKMREVVAQPWSTNSVARVDLGISQGAHSDRFNFSIIDGGHLELFVAGPAVTQTVACEGEAGRGQILVSDATASLLPEEWLGETTESGARDLLYRRVSSGDHTEGAVRAERLPSTLDRFLPPALVDQIAVPNPGEHRQVSVAFVTVAETDTLSKEQGPQALHDAFCTIAENVREVLASHEVHWLASDAYENGGKIILTAGAPTASAADEDALLLAVHELFEMPSPLPLRCGVNRGHVFVGDLGAPGRRTFTIMGDAVNLAARLMQKAAPGQVVVSADMLDKAHTVFDHEELEPFMVKGKSKPIEASILRAPQGVGDDTDDVDEGPMVGRQEELARLVELADEAASGTGSAVEISGEAGSGKSRLIQELVTSLDGFEVMGLRGGQYAKNTPYFVIRRQLQRMLDIAPTADRTESGMALASWVAREAPHLAPWMPLLAIVVGAEVGTTPEVDRLAEEFRRERLVRVAADALLVATREPFLLIAEDAYWFDEGSLDILRALASGAQTHKCLIVATTRTSQLRPLEAVPGVTELALGPLTFEETLELVEQAAREQDPDHGRDLRPLAERAGGHPLFALEMVSASLESDDDALPDTVESLVTTRIDRLVPADRLLLREASVGGAVVDMSVLADAIDAPDVAATRRWRGLLDFVQPDGHGMLRFRQALYREVAYQGLAYSRRRQVHLLMGEELERRAGDEPDAVAGLLAVHFDEARDQDRAWRYSAFAGDSARSSYANAEAIALYTRALSNESGSPSTHDKAVVAESLGDVLDLTARYDDAYDAYQRSRGNAGDDDEPRLLRKIGRLRQRQGELSQSLRWLTRGLKALGGLGRRDEADAGEAEIALIRAGTLHHQGRNKESAKWAERAARAADRAGDRLTQARAYNMLEVALRTLGDPSAEEMARQALELYDGSGDVVGEANVWNNLGIRAYYSGEWSEAVRCYERSRELRDQAGDVSGGALAANNLAEVLSLQGRYDEAEQLVSDAIATWRSAGNSVGAAYATVNLALIVGRSGDSERARELVASALETFNAIGAVGLVQEARLREVELRLLAGDPSGALALAVPLARELASDQDGDPELVSQLDPLITLAEVRTGSLTAATHRLAEALGRIDTAPNTYVEALLHLAAAEVAFATGEPGRAEVSRGHGMGMLASLDVVRAPLVDHVDA